jgi:hypothetical protein
MLPGQIDPVTKFGSVVFNGVNLISSPQYNAYRNSDLWTDEAFRGENRQLPRRPGRRPKKKYFEETRYLLPLVVSGAVGAGGSYLGLNGAEGRCLSLLMNLKTNLAGTDANSKVTIAYILPGSLGTWTSDAQFLGLRKEEYGSGLWNGHLEFILLKPWVLS